MDDFLMIGKYHFIGLHLCSTLLSQGLKIKGISYPDFEVHQLEEKEMFFGRNANFIDIKWEQRFKQIKEGETIIVFDCYTLDKLDDLIAAMQEFFKGNRWKMPNKVVAICPATMEEVQNKQCTKFFKEKKIPYQFIYLPTIYGPWQPESFLFQQILLKEINKNLLPKQNEYTKDAIFVEDAVEEIMEQIQNNQNEDILLRSVVQNHWQKCMDVLNYSLDYVEDCENYFAENKFTINVKNKNKIADNLALQTKHIKMYINPF
ncbi:hypothetical protein [Niallia nealsonii]|uniref:Uncharacterized protein n=1 Tax=Niallia nealsonii TaxID=115979 RepID=A0A2N0Z7Q7_9BACI|nr:hypothetical protein [Niallia nealsonii]PKG25524.1 hypothetical protein CWS01_01380 [Niallia nealsonii]